MENRASFCMVSVYVKFFQALLAMQTGALVYIIKYSFPEIHLMPDGKLNFLFFFDILFQQTDGIN